jgi:hypothetical protein
VRGGVGRASGKRQQNGKRDLRESFHNRNLLPGPVLSLPQTHGTVPF